MAQNAIVGSTLTDLGRIGYEQDALKNKEDLQRMSDFFALASKRADLQARQTEADKERALKFFELGQSKTLAERKLDLEDKALTAEANRWAEGLKFQAGE